MLSVIEFDSLPNRANDPNSDSHPNEQEMSQGILAAAQNAADSAIIAEAKKRLSYGTN